MTRAEAWLSHAAAVLVGGTGLVYGWMRWFVEPTDPYALVNHPLEPDVQHLHVLFAPLLVFAVGLVWREHVWKRVRSGFRPRRATGLALFVLVGPMIATGYLLQVATDPTWRSVWTWSHVATSVLWTAVYVVHQLSPRPAQLAGVRG